MSTHELFGSDSESSDNENQTQELPSTQAHMEELFGNNSDSNEDVDMEKGMVNDGGFQSYPIQDQGSDSSSNEDDKKPNINQPSPDEPMNVDQDLNFSDDEETNQKVEENFEISDEENEVKSSNLNKEKLNESEILKQSMPTTQDLFGDDLDDDSDDDDDDDDDGDNIVIKDEKIDIKAPTTQDLFGDEDLDVSSDEETLNEPKEQVNTDLDDDQPPSPTQEGEEKEEEGLSIAIELPRCNMSLGKELYFVKLPNFLSVDTKPFDPALYEDEIDDDEILDEEGRTRLKLKVENTLRWRYSKDREGNEVKESNCRFVRWSDGSLTMHLGNEVFDVFKMPIEGEQNHLFVQQGTGLQAQAVFKTKLSFRPQSTASQTHRKMTMSIADRMSKAQKIKFMPATDHDPESQRSTIMKKEDERMRAQSRRESQQRRMREKNHLKGMTAGYLEGDADNDEEDFDNSIAAIKNRYKKDVKGRNPYHEVYSDESDGDDKLEKAKLDFDSDELSDPEIRRKKEELSKKKKGSRKVIEESDEEESE